MKKLVGLAFAAALYFTPTTASAWWGWNPWPVWTPMYWMEEMVGDDYWDGYGPHGYGPYGYAPYGGYGPWGGYGGGPWGGRGAPWGGYGGPWGAYGYPGAYPRY